MPPQSDFDLMVIGAGPGGYVAAIRAAQLGMKVACVEREYLGGTCLNVGCIPSKALLDSTHRLHETRHHLPRLGINIAGKVDVDLPAMLKFKDEVVQKNTSGVAYLFKKNKVEHVKGHARIKNPTTVEVSTTAAGGSARIVTAKNILIATGSAPIEIPALPFDGKNIISSTEALALTEVPQRMIVVGGGYIGVEMGSVWSRLGSDVLVLEFMPRILPASDEEMALALQKLLEKQGMRFRFNCTADSAKIENGKVKLAWKSGAGAGAGAESATEEVEKVLVCVGRRPVTDNLGLDKLGVAVTAKGYVQVNERFQTNIETVYAIGDVIGGLMLAHKAEEEGIAAVEGMLPRGPRGGHSSFVNYRACPSVVYTHPQLASVGYSEDEATEAGHKIKIGKFPFSANGYARATDEIDGFVKVIADAGTDRILGVHILGGDAAHLIAEAALAMEFAASAEDLARSFHAHPTLSEALKEAALAVDKKAIHI